MPAHLACLGAGGAGTVGGTPVDLVLTFESGTVNSALTLTDLNNATTKSAAAAGSWAMGTVAPTVDNSLPFTPSGGRKFKVGASAVPEGGTKGIRMNTGADQVMATYTLTTAAPAVSIGFALYIQKEGTFNFYNWCELTGTGGSDLVACHNFDNSPNSQVASEDNVSGLGTYINIATSGMYWITMLYDNTNNLAKLRVYDPATWAQLGVESTTSPVMSTNCNRFSIGRTDNHDVFGSVNHLYDYVAVCLSTGVGATFPLLPT